MLLRVPRSDRLEPGLKRRVAFPYSRTLLARESNSIARGCQIDDSEIHTERSVEGLDLLLFREVDDQHQVEDPVDVDEICLSLDSVLVELSVLSVYDRNKRSPFERQDRNSIRTFDSQSPLIVDHRPMRLEGVFHRSVGLITLGDFPDRPDNHLGRKSKSFSNIVIEDLLELDLPERSVQPCYIGDVVAGFVEPLHRLQEVIVLRLRRQ